MNGPVILGIETSCDETAAALLVDGKIVSDRTTRQLVHEEYGGVVPELASRAHERLLTPAVEGVLGDAGLSYDAIDGIAVTFGPGLAGALLVGVSFAKGLSKATGASLIGINHLEGHLWSVELSRGEIPKPFLTLLVSGGHTLMIKATGFGRYELLGETRDDAAGELFDKVGRMLGYNFPAGADIDREKMSFSGNSVRFPRARLSSDPYGFSFSGLKTAVLYYLQENYPRARIGFNIPPEDRSAVCAGLMEAVGDMLITGLTTASEKEDFRAVVVSGGVSASVYLRGRFRQFASEQGLPLYIPPLEHCTDNGAMVAYTGYRKFLAGDVSMLDLAVNPAASLFGDGD